MRAFTRICFVRHGEVDPSWAGRVYGDLDVPLSERGRADMEAIAGRFAGVELDAAVSTGLSRSEAGAKAVAAGHGLPVTLERDLRELDRGEWRGLTWPEVEAKFPGGRRRFHAEPDYREHGGESLADLEARVARAVERLRSRHPGGTIAVIGHLWPIRCAIAGAIGLPLTRIHRVLVETAAISVVDYHETGSVLAALNLREGASLPPTEAPPV